MDQYELAMHTVKVRRSGMLSDVSVLCDRHDSGMVSGSAQNELLNSKLKIERLPSINSFNKVRGRRKGYRRISKKSMMNPSQMPDFIVQSLPRYVNPA